MEDLKALTECAECTWDYIDRMRMALASACKERDEARKELHEAKSELDAAVRGQETLQKALAECKADRDVLRNELCCKCGKYREAHNGACDGCRWRKDAQ